MLKHLRAAAAAAGLNALASLEHEGARRFTAAWNALAPKRIAAIR